MKKRQQALFTKLRRIEPQRTMHGEEVNSGLKNTGFGGVIITTMGWKRKQPEIIEAMRG